MNFWQQPNMTTKSGIETNGNKSETHGNVRKMIMMFYCCAHESENQRIFNEMKHFYPILLAQAMSFNFTCLFVSPYHNIVYKDFKERKAILCATWTYWILQNTTEIKKENWYLVIISLELKNFRSHVQWSSTNCLNILTWADSSHIVCKAKKMSS
jgi:hypothetical protein